MSDYDMDTEAGMMQYAEDMPTPPADSPSELHKTIYESLVAQWWHGQGGESTMSDEYTTEIEQAITAHDRRRDEAHAKALLKAVGENETGEWLGQYSTLPLDELRKRFGEPSPLHGSIGGRNILRAELRAAIAAEFGEGVQV